MPDESWITNHTEDSAPRIDDAGLAPLLSPLFHSRVVADQHYQRGLDQESRGQWERALASFRTACALHPERVLYLLARGRICQTHDLDPEAADCYEHARRIAPRDVDLTLEALLRLPVRFEQPRWLPVMLLSRELDVSMYDATYIEVAQHLGLPMVTADRRLATAAAAAGL
ncbi:MAG: hypothetical protein EB039_09800, partial [Proteobacteria bacterium]|nr:hypothetical protein [Pseudomonadota bacterium]